MPLVRAPRMDLIGHVPKRRKGGPPLRHRAIAAAGRRPTDPGMRQDAMRTGMATAGQLLGFGKAAGHEAFGVRRGQ